MLSELVVNSFIQKFCETENFCGFTLPYIFKNGTPAIIHAQRRTTHILLSDHGMNASEMVECIGYDSFIIENKLKELVKPCEFLIATDNIIQATVNEKTLDFAILEFVQVLQAMTLFEYSPRIKFINEIMDRIKTFLTFKYNTIQEHTKVKGRSGVDHHFNFSSSNTLIDIAKPSASKTGVLLRKYIDTSNFNDKLNFNLILDDSDKFQFNREAQVLSDFATITPLSTAIH